MCLNLRSRSKQPYAKNVESNIRWKYVKINVDNKRGYGGRFKALYSAPYRRYTSYKLKEWNYAKGENYGPQYFGFHVFLTKAEAESSSVGGEPCRLLKKVKVSGFLRSGKFNCKRCETYRRFKFIKTKES